MESMRDLELKVIQWAEDRNIFAESTNQTRFKKLEEEVYELKEALLKYSLEKIKLEAGDVIVTLINFLHPMGLDLETCLSAAYEKIRVRTGKMENGTFVKDTPTLDESEIKKAWLGEKKWQGEEKAGNINLKFVKEAVDHPAHYTAYPVEVIDIIRVVLGPEGFRAYCMGNEIKYRMRAGLKGDALEDIQKAMKYKQFREE